ncbi:FIVAR domain-containing protein [Paenibacillus tritici]|uniref:S-layer homology domain-containing protein n=1 Tax=Paenibacillus tritici TaxID=1873425 RepID=UPI001BAC2177|nr:S-layer homology domain-containing protein [Paenibacillus tritici]QUL54948.1 FIVAR domain-containing protein [Paenibacillus tritici]
MVSNNMNLRKIGIMFLIFTLVFTGMGLSFGASVSYAASSDIYVASNGNDNTGDGTEDKPFATLPKANQEVVSGGTIYVMDDITLSPVQPGKFLELRGGKQITITTDPNASQTAVIKRGGSGTLLDLLDGHLTLKNIIIDGMGTNSAGRIVNVYDASSLTIEDGAILRNNNINNLPASVIYVSDPASTVKMTGGEISGNKYAGTATSAILLSNGEFTMSGGQITGNIGGGVEVAAGKFILSGTGQITENLIASGKGQNVNLKGSNLLYMNGDFTGKAGITAQNRMTEGSKFGEAIAGDLKGIKNLFADNTPSIFAAYGEGNALVWKKAPAPGGVGVNNGLISWVDVGKSANPENGLVTELQDLAINEKWDRTETNRNIPYSANAVNYNPAIQVTSATTYFKKASVGTPQDTQREVFSVQASSDFSGFPWDLGGKSATSEYGNTSGKLIRTYFGSDSYKDIDVTGYDLKKTRVMNIWSAVDTGNPNKDQWSFSLDGKQLDPVNGTGDQHKVDFTLAAGGKVYIGAGHFSRFNGSISEVIVFNKKLSETERHKVNSYLALKYGLSLKDANGQLIDYVTSNHDAEQTSTMWTAANNQGYGNRITGIGRDDQGALDQKQSKSQDNGANVTISLGATVANSNEENTQEIANDKSFFVFSDNGAGTEFISSIDKDNESLKHTARIHKVEKTNWADKDSETGSPVQITLQVDKVEPAEQWPLYLVVSADDQFDHQDKFYELVDGKATLSSEDFNNGSYFTIAAPSPKLISAILDQATANSKQIVFTFDQNVVLTDSTGFSIEMDGTEVPIGQVSIKVDPVDTTKLIVTLPSGTDIAGKTVTVSYNGKGNLKGSNGVPVDAFAKDITKLAKPNAQLNKDMLSWGPIDHADNYEVTVKLSDGTSITKAVYGAELDLSTLGLKPGSYDVTVTAKSDNDAYVDSEASNSVTYTVLKVDKTALEGKVTEAGTLDKKEYTAESWSNLERELTEANNVLNNPNATQDQVDQALAELQKALDDLEKIKVDKTALQGKVTEAGTLDKKEYTAESWSNLERELTEANNVLNNPNATQDQVDQALAELQKALDDLEKIKVDKTALENKVSEAGTLDKKEYTAESWSNLERELTEANNVLNNPNATQDQVDQALAELQKALDDLEKIKVDKTALQGKVTEAGTLDKKEYTAESWSNLERELTEANNVLNNPNATQDQVDQALAELQKALDDLIVTSGELKEINLVGLTNEGSQAIPLTPEFDPNQNKNYKGTVTNNVYGVSLNPVTKYPDDTQVKITVNNEEYPSDKWNKLPLNEGENEIRVGVYNTAGELINEYIYIIVREKAPGNGGNNGGGSDGSGGNSGTSNPSTPPTLPTPPTTENTNIITTVNGSNQSFATGTVTPNGDQATVTIDPNKLASFIADGKGHKLGIRVPGNGDVEVQGLTLEDLKKIADTGSSLDIEDVLAIYPVPAGQIDVNAISRQFGNAPISNIAVNIKIKRSADDVTKLAREKATLGSYELLVNPVDLDLSFMHDGKTDRAGALKGYAPKYIALPEGIDPNRITTGVIVNPDGSVFHVPTVVTKINNRYFALINDLRSSGTYSVIWNPQDFGDVRNHWGKEDVNNIAARLSLKGNGDNTFSPNRSVSRSEFAEIVVTGLGLMRQNVTQADFSDVPASAWYKDSVAIADEFDIVRGYDDSNFKGDQQITREQGFAMIARAYRLIQSEDLPSQEKIASTLASYTDGTNVAAWAQGDVAQLIQAGIIQGNGPQSLDPKAQMARAEVTALIARMLKVTDLIDK